MEEWKEYKLGDVCDISIGRTPPRAESEWFNPQVDFYNWISIKDMGVCGKHISSTSETISIEGQKRFNIPLVLPDTVILSFKLTVGRVAITSNKIMLTNEAIAQLPIIDKKLLDKDFLYYYLKIFNYNKLGSTSSIATAVNSKMVKNITILCPALQKQQKIASILSSLDDKIEVNRRINENLEQQVQALFKSWFVDFEPFKDGEFAESELGMIPKGWRIKELADIAVISKESINPQKQPQKEFNHYSIPSYDDGMTPEIQLGEEIKSNKFIIKNKMTLFSKLNPRIKRVWFVDKLVDNSICSTEFVPYKAKEESKSALLYSLINSQGFYDFVMSMVNGATGSHQRFHPEDSLRYKIAYNETYSIKYCEIATPIINKLLDNREESHRLAELRNTLLPKLMSGEIKVNDIH